MARFSPFTVSTISLFLVAFATTVTTDAKAAEPGDAADVSTPAPTDGAEGRNPNDRDGASTENVGRNASGGASTTGAAPADASPPNATPTPTSAAATSSSDDTTSAPATPTAPPASTDRFFEVTRHPPVGRAAPPTEAATHAEGPIRAGLEIFAQYKYSNLKVQDGTSSWFHAFDVPRVHAAVEAGSERLRGRVLVEATRSAAEGALLGVAGDSLVLRIREAYGAVRPVEALELSAGVVPTLTIPELDGTWMMRAVAPSALEASGFASPADLGARARFDFPKRYGYVAAAAYNGEGYTSRELNRGKTFEGAVEVHPLAAGALLPLGVFASYVAGSTGTALARADRATGGLVWQGERVRAGAFATWARGVRQVGTQNGLVLSAFVRAEPVDRILVGARFDHTVRDLDGNPADTLSTVLGSLGYRVADSLEGFVAVTRTIPSARFASESPGTDAWEGSIVGRFVY